MTHLKLCPSVFDVFIYVDVTRIWYTYYSMVTQEPDVTCTACAKVALFHDGKYKPLNVVFHLTKSYGVLTT
jgi:hypothetical protein